jgi:hypothetical protein
MLGCFTEFAPLLAIDGHCSVECSPFVSQITQTLNDSAFFDGAFRRFGAGGANGA